MPVLRLPNRNTRWVWEIDKPDARCIIEVESVKFNGDEWWVATHLLPDFRSTTRNGVADHNDLDRFWEAVTPIGGRRDDLSNPISENQYKRS